MTKHEYVNCPKCNHRHLKQAIHCPNCLKNAPKSTIWLNLAVVFGIVGLLIYIPFQLFSAEEPSTSSQPRMSAQEQATINEQNIARIQAERAEEKRERELIRRRSSLMENVIGQWCDEMIPTQPSYNYVISIAGKEQPFIVFNFSDGSIKIDPLEAEEPEDPKRFTSVESSNGEYFEITTTGSLRIADANGLIREASPLVDAIQAGTCSE